jgi:hypothetical protein
MQSCELVSYITALACAISKCCSNDELSVLATAFTQLGDTLATIAAQNQLCGKNADS